MVCRLNKLAALLVLVLALCASVFAQAPSDTNNQPATPTTSPTAGSPVTTTPAPVPTTTQPGTTPTTTPPATPPSPTVTTKKPATDSASTDDGTDSGSSAGGATVPKTTTPTPTVTTKAPVVGAAAPTATPATTPPAVTTTSPEILIDRTVKSTYGTRSPASTEATATTSSESEASKMGSWLVPAVIGAVIVSALIIMTFFVRSRRSGGHADEDYNTPRRGSENFMEHPKTTTSHQVAVPVLGDPVKDKVSADQSSMKTVAVGGAHHSPRAHRVASSPPLMSELSRPPSPGFGTYKQKPMEGSSVHF